MKDMKKVIKMQFNGFLIFALTIAIFGCKYEQFKTTEKPFVDKTSVELFVGDGAGDRNTIQLKSSPEGKQYVWKSFDTSIATVSQNGVITAVKEGFTTVSVVSDNDATNVSVWVRTWIPLIDFRFDVEEDEIIQDWMDRFKIPVIYNPTNASAQEIQWTSSDPGITSVSENGWISSYQAGKATLTATSYNGIVKTIDVIVRAPLSFANFISRKDWTFPGYDDGSQNATNGYSSQATNEGGSPNGRVIALLDNNSGTFWHTAWSPATDYPNWFIIDMQEKAEIYGIMLQRRQGNNGLSTAKGFTFYTCETEPTDENDPVNGYNWVDCGHFSFNITPEEQQKIHVKQPFPIARYVKVYFGANDKGTGNYCQFAEFGLFGKVMYSFSNRRVTDVKNYFQEYNGQPSVMISFSTAAPGLVRTEIRYQKSDGTMETINLSPADDVIACPFAKPGTTFDYRTIYNMDTEIITDWDTHDVPFPNVDVYRVDRSTWEVLSVSDQTASDGGGMHMLIDDNLGTYWHSMWHDGNGPCPHWAIIDMKRANSFSQVDVYRRPGNTDAKTVEIYLGDTSSASGAWTKIGEGEYPNSQQDLLSIVTDKITQGRYLKLVVVDSYRDPFTSIAEIYPYKDF